MSYLIDPRESGPGQTVTCGRCERVYVCTAEDDHYLPTGAPHGGVRFCYACLIIVRSSSVDWRTAAGCPCGPDDGRDCDRVDICHEIHDLITTRKARP